MASKLKSNPRKMDENKYYQFHKDHSHDTDDCITLKEKIEEPIKR